MLPRNTAATRSATARSYQVRPDDAAYRRSLAATYKVTASKTATHRPSDKTNITIQDAAGLSREEGFGSGL